MNVLRLRVTDDMPMAARVLVWPRDQGGYFIYVRPGTPRGSVRSALRELKTTSAAHRELTVIAFAAKNAWRSPRERVMSFGAGLATTVIASGLATSVAVPEMAVAPAIHHHARSLLPSWANLDPGSGRAGKQAPAASHHPGGSPSVTPSRLPQSPSGTSGTAAGLPSRSAAARKHLAPGAQKADAPKKAAKKETKKETKRAAKKETKAGKAGKPIPAAKKAKLVKASKPRKPSRHPGKR